MKFRKILAGALVSAMTLMAWIPPFIQTEMIVSAVTESTYGDLKYIAYYDYAEITGCDSAAVSVNIPGEISGLPVTVIGDHAFYSCESLEDITVPDSVAIIGTYAFSGCISLTGIKLPDSVNSIGTRAFENCESLTGVTLPEGITDISHGMFSGCISLTDIKLPGSIKKIGRNAFSYCKSLSDIAIPDSVASIADEAFMECAELENITLPDKVASVGYGVFTNCSSLEDITILNPECEIFYSKRTISNESKYVITVGQDQVSKDISLFNGTIHGRENSTAQDYAEKYGYKFEAIENDIPTVPIKGDISGNGKTDLYDAIEIAESLIGTRTFTEEEKETADFNGDGKVDLYDAIAIAKYIISK